MTDAEIRQSRIDHAHQLDEIAHIVRINTPSRIVGIFGARSKRAMVLIDFGLDAIVEVPREPRRR